MSANTWMIIAIVGFALAAVSLVVAVILFVKLNIPSVIGDLSGRTVAREVQAIREANASSGEKIHRSSRVNIDRGPLTTPVTGQVHNVGGVGAALAHKSMRLDVQDSDPPRPEPQRDEYFTSFATDVLDTDGTVSLGDAAAPTDILRDADPYSMPTELLHEESTGSEPTDILTQSAPTELLPNEPTELLPNEPTELLQDDQQATTLLCETEGTTVLNADTEELHDDGEETGGAFKIVRKLGETHTDEKL